MKTCPEEVKTATGVKDTRKQREGYKKKKKKKTEIQGRDLFGKKHVGHQVHN